MRSRWIPLTLMTIAAVGLLAALISISVGEEEAREIRMEQTGEVQELIAGIPQLGNRLGSDDAPVQISLFIDIQCQSCADYMAAVIDPLIAERARTGGVKILLRHRPVGLKPSTLGAFGTVAAAHQNRGWQYAEIFARNLDKVPESGVDDGFLNEVAAVTPKLDTAAWERDVASDEIQAEAQADDELAFELGIPGATTLIVEGAGGSETLERSPPLAQVEAAIERVR
jgi:protein-disulfide isomerase